MGVFSKFLKRLRIASDTTVFFVFIGSLAVFNVAFIDSGGWARFAWNTLGYLGLFAVYKISRFKSKDIGLSKDQLKAGLKYSVPVIAVILFAFLLIFIVDKNAFKDSRYHHELGTALFAALILLPLKTVLFEEIAFRGIIPALLVRIKNSQRYATIVSSLLFGLWHVISATKIDDNNIAGGASAPSILVVIGVFIATSIAGYIFCQLRWRSGSLVVPIFAHWTINASAIILASLSWR